MDLKKFLEENPIINQAVLARSMWPENKSANTKLANKLAENKAGTGKQRITEKDYEKAKEVLRSLATAIRKL